MTSAIINHLWQSTFFALGLALLTLVFRKNRAQVRYWLWLSASLKFLVPFALLMTIGNDCWHAIVKKKMAAEIATPPLAVAIAQITQPFPDALPLGQTTSHQTDWIRLVVLGAWACGFFAVVLLRFRGWLRIRAVLQCSTPMSISAGVRARSSPDLLEPGIVGFLRPILLLPEGIQSLTTTQLEAVVAHELSHIRRHDNLTAALHMFVEAIFWFHPLVWWIGAKLIEEREQACDEAVLRLGSDPKDYAEAILKVCKLYVESPLICVAGVTGASLKKRIHAILAHRPASNLNFAKKVVLTITSAAALALPIIVGIVKTPSVRAFHAPAAQSAVPQWQTEAGGTMAFSVVYVNQNASGTGRGRYANVSLGPGDWYTPDGGLFSSINMPLINYILFAYKSTGNQESFIRSELPKWALTQGFDIQARAQGNPTKDQMRLMMQSLLTERFKFVMHTETRQVPVFALVLQRQGNLGPQLQGHSDDPPCSTDPFAARAATVADGFPTTCDGVTGLPPSVPGGRVRVGGRNVTMELIANSLKSFPGDLDRPVLDKTGLSGTFDFTLEWTPQMVPPGSNFHPDPTGPPFLQALQKQLGLNLEPQTSSLDVPVIDHVESLSKN